MVLLRSASQEGARRGQKEQLSGDPVSKQYRAGPVGSSGDGIPFRDGPS